ncbi:MAG TPA: ferrochelatase, partial [Candidatus Baltobacteraceae bacterium]
AADVARELRDEGIEKPVVIILAAHQSPASWDKYTGLIPGGRYVPPYYEHPLFVRANAARVREALQRLGKRSFDGVELIFTAHSIPQAMADASPYEAQLRRSAQLVAREAGAQSWRIAYQSRSGSPAEKWLEPDIRDVLRALPGERTHEAIVAPVGFLCDHVEVLYDLDVDAAKAAKDAGVAMERASALNDHPLFIEMMADLAMECA